MSLTQGFLANLTVDAVTYTDVTVSAPLARSKASLNKATQDGSGQMVVIPGMESGSLSVSGFIDDVTHNSLEATYAKQDAVPFTLEAAKGLATDSAWAGNLVLVALTVEPSESGLWEFSFDAETSGPVVYTPSVV